jgi:hypothetical protein
MSSLYTTNVTPVKVVLQNGIFTWRVGARRFDVNVIGGLQQRVTPRRAL